MQQLTLPGVGNVGQLQAKYETWLKQQHPAVEVAIATITSSVQGMAIGYLLGSVSAMSPPDPKVAATNPQLAALSAGGPWGQARNLGVLTGVNAGLSLAIKKARNGKEDVWGA